MSKASELLASVIQAKGRRFVYVQAGSLRDVGFNCESMDDRTDEQYAEVVRRDLENHLTETGACNGGEETENVQG